MTSRVAMLELAAFLAGCATQTGAPAPQPQPPLTAAAERGFSLAGQRCGGCHALGLLDESRQSMAPPFRDMSLRYNDIAFERRMAELDGRGHGEMPPVRLATSEARDLTAYIHSLNRPWPA